MKRQLQTGIADAGPASSPMYRRALLCKTGTWLGSDGEVTVTRKILEGLANKYNADKAKALNKNDYAPVLKDHDRRVENVFGRIDTSRVKLSVEPLEDGEYGLFSELRIDDEIAQVKVDKGVYAHLSLSFDDENFEIYEVSFVAVEAARGSQILSKGDKKMSKKLKVVALGLVNSVVATNREVSLGIVNGVKKTNEGVTSLQANLALVQTNIKAASIKSLFHGFIREGKMNKAELSKINIKELSSLSPTALKAVTDAYANRRPSTDIQQYGVTGAKPVHGDISPSEFKKLRDQQLSAGKGKNLSAGEDEDKDKDKESKKDLSASKEDEGTENLAAEDVDGIQKMLHDCIDQIKSLSEGLDSINSYAKKLQVEDKKEEELASGDDDSKEDDKKDSKDLSAEDDDDSEDKNKDEK